MRMPAFEFLSIGLADQSDLLPSPVAAQAITARRLLAGTAAGFPLFIAVSGIRFLFFFAGSFLTLTLTGETLGAGVAPGSTLAC